MAKTFEEMPNPLGFPSAAGRPIQLFWCVCFPLGPRYLGPLFLHHPRHEGRSPTRFFKNATARRIVFLAVDCLSFPSKDWGHCGNMGKHNTKANANDRKINVEAKVTTKAKAKTNAPKPKAL